MTITTINHGTSNHHQWWASKLGDGRIALESSSGRRGIRVILTQTQAKNLASELISLTES